MQFKVPDEVLAEMEKVSFPVDTNTYSFKVVYPIDYDSSKVYDAVLGFSGGNAAERLVDYCYYAMFKTNHFNDRFIFMPIGINGKLLQQLDENEMMNITELLTENFPVAKQNWIITGTSNGGIAAFRFAYMQPELYSGIIVMPGALSFDDVHDKWADYKVLLACGENDDQSWIDAMHRDEELLSKKIENVFTYIINGEGHIISPAYNQDLIYDLYFIGKDGEKIESD